MAWRSLEEHRKYRNEKTKVDGITFDSKHEAERYKELRMLEKAGKIRDLKRQQKYVLIPALRDHDGKCIERQCVYISDFEYFDIDQDRHIVEDAKGMRTKEYIIKRKLMLYQYGIRIHEV